jgi:hypothetical protein
MSKLEMLDALLHDNNGYLKTCDAVGAGVSRTYLSAYVQGRGLERVAHGLYASADAWDDGMFIIQTRYPTAIFSHETALYLLGLAEREPIRYSLTLKAGANTTGLTKQGIKVYKVKPELFDEGLTEAETPVGHTVRAYNPERTICDIIRSRRNIDNQDLQAAIKGYVRSKDKNIPLLLRYAKSFSVEKIVRQYLEVLL